MTGCIVSTMWGAAQGAAIADAPFFVLERSHKIDRDHALDLARTHASGDDHRRHVAAPARARARRPLPALRLACPSRPPRALPPMRALAGGEP